MPDASVPGQLVLAHRRGDSAAYALLERCGRADLADIQPADSLERRLRDASIRPPPAFAAELHLLSVEPGGEIAAINRLHEVYAGEWLRANAGQEPEERPRPSLAVEPNIRLRLAAPRNCTLDTTWHSIYEKMIGLPDTSNSKGAGVTVAIVDSGIVANHGCTVDASGSKCFCQIHPASHLDDPEGHGTMIANIVQSIAADATLRIIKVADGLDLWAWDALAGLAAAAGCPVVNLSFGFPLADRSCTSCGYLARTTRSKVFEAVLDQVLASNPETVVVAAAGNEGKNDFPFPARFPEALTVGSVVSSRARAPNSNYGLTTLDPGDAHPNVVFAPGGDSSEVVGETDPPTVRRHGTSFAAAYVSGLIAVYLGRPSVTQRDRATTLAYLKTHADRSVCANPTGADTTFGFGVVRLV